MKKLSFYLIALLLIPTFIFTSCKDDTKVEPANVTLANYLTANHMDLSDVLSYTTATGDAVKFVTAAPATDADVAAWAANYYIIDIRSAADYALGHIPGANNAEFKNILSAATNAGDKRILMVCYTGQTACYATALLRLAGFPDAQALKWGMSGWNASLDKWTANVSDIAAGSNNWTTAAAPANVKYELPTLTEAGDGATILAARLAAVVANGFKTAKGSDVLATPSNYFINNYFSDGDFTAFGHFDGAHRINPLTIADDIVKNIDPAAKVVTYCYTGQTSAIITAYLNVLGYDAYSLSFGMNGLYNSSTAWSSNQWGVDSKPKNLSTVTK